MPDDTQVSSVNEPNEPVTGDEPSIVSPSEEASPSDEPSTETGLTDEELSSVFPAPKRDPDEDRRNMTEALIEKNVERISQIEDEDEREAMLSKFPKLRETVEARLMDRDLSMTSRKKEEEISQREQNLLKKEFQVEMAALPVSLGMEKAVFAKHKTDLLKKVSEIRGTEYGKLMPISELLETAAIKLGLHKVTAKTEENKAAKEQLRKDMALPSTSGKRSPSFGLLAPAEFDALKPDQRSAYVKESMERYDEVKFK